MKTIIILLALILIMSGCIESQTHSFIPYRKNFEFKNLNDSIKNDEKCLELCKGREAETTYNGDTGIYRCDYEPVICSNDTCLCKTF